MSNCADDAGGAAPGRLLVFLVGGQRFGVELSWVRGVAAHEGGSHRGLEAGSRTGTVVDARALGWAGEAAVPPVGAAVAEILLGRGAEAVVVLVDAVDGIEEAGEFRGWPRLIAAHIDPVFRGVALQPGGTLVVIDAGALIPETGRGAAGRAREA